MKAEGIGNPKAKTKAPQRTERPAASQKQSSSYSGT